MIVHGLHWIILPSSSYYPSTNCSDGIAGMCHDFLIALRIAEVLQSYSSSFYPSANCSARIGRIVHTLQNWGRIIGLPRIAEILQSHSSSLYPSTNCSDGIVGMCHDFLIVLGLHIRRGNLACLWSAGYLDLQSVWKLMDYTKFHGLLFFSGECKRFQDCTCNWIDLYWLFQNYGDPMELD